MRLRAASLERLVDAHYAGSMAVGETFRGSRSGEHLRSGARVPALNQSGDAPEVEPGWEVLFYLARQGYSEVPVLV